jgi:hypothetical protein
MRPAAVSQGELLNYINGRFAVASAVWHTTVI